MKVLVFDFEVFRFDTLLGVYDVNNNKYIQMWDLEEIKKFYFDNISAIWVGHNNSHYDNYILQAIIEDKNPYEISKRIIDDKNRIRLNIHLFYYDTMSNHFASLKVLEAYMGKNISESEVDFDLRRKLTDYEKKQVESYNRDDLDQTFLNLKLIKPEFQLKLDLIKEFGLSLRTLSCTQAQIASVVLKAKKIPGIDLKSVELPFFENLRVKNEKVLKFYKDREWDWSRGALRKSIKVDFGGISHTIAAGGIHAGELCHEDWAYYLDVSGYYNLVMINYNLLSRAIPDEGKKLYEYMYHEQLRLKKIDPVKRNVYKVILLAVFGAQNNKYCEFYDPYQGDLVRLTGELFLVDLLEKVEKKAKIIQSNTDGIMIKPFDNATEEEIMDIVNEWQTRTKFVLKVEKIFDIIQRDVNNYMYKDIDGKIHVKGEAVKHWKCSESPFESDSYNSKEPIIISKCIVEYFMNNKKPEDTIAENKNNVRLFQYICKKGTYDYLSFESNGSSTILQKVNRCFVGNHKNTGVIYKHKGIKKDKYSNIPGKVFVMNGDLSKNINLTENIDYNYYVNRAYERIDEFKPKIEQLTLF